MSKKLKITYPKRGEIYLVNFDPTVGAEIKKKRPALILQHNIANQYSPITIVAAISSQFDKKLYPTEVFIKKLSAPSHKAGKQGGPASGGEGGLKVDSVVLLNQIRSIDKRRLIKRLGTLKEETMFKINNAIQISLGLVKI